MNFVDQEEDDDPEPDDDSTGEHLQQFHVNARPDRDGFLRRTCPGCGRDFKTTINEAELSHLLHAEVERVGREMGLPLAEDESVKEEVVLICPYCDHCANANEMLPEELVDYLKRQLYREIVLPMLDNTFGGLADSFKGGGFVKLEYSRGPLPPRPIHGPEPADMKIVSLLCCGERVKISETWNLMDTCPYCGEPIVIV